MEHFEVKLSQINGWWIWELYDGINRTWIENSGAPFKTPEEAARDGARARAQREQRDCAQQSSRIDCRRPPTP
jgi:hypothetical protein